MQRPTTTLMAAVAMGVALTGGRNAAEQRPVGVQPGVGVTVAKLQLEKTQFATIPGERAQVMHIGAGVGSSLAVLSRHDARYFDAMGGLQRTTPFPAELWRPVLTRLSLEDPVVIVGLHPVSFEMLRKARSSVYVLAAETGAELLRLPAWEYAHVEAADVSGDRQAEFLIRRRNGVEVHSAHGKRLAFVEAPEYLYHFKTVGSSAEPHRRIALWMYRNPKEGAMVRVVRADGGVVADWRERPSNRFSVFAFSGAEERLWSAVDNDFIGRTLRGEVVERLAAPAAGHFRHLFGAEILGRRKVVLASGGSAHAGSMVAVFDADGQLVYQEFLVGHSWAFYAPGTETGNFYVGNGPTVFKYTVKE